MNRKIINKNSAACALDERMKRGTAKTLRVVGILLVIFFLFSAFALLTQPLRATNTVTATVTVGSGPIGVSVTPNGEYAYVTNHDSGSVSVISTATNRVTVTVTNVEDDPFGVAVTPNGEYAYVTNDGSGTVSVISTATNTVNATVTVGTNPMGVAVTPNGEYAYVTNGGSGSVSVINVVTPAPTQAPTSAPTLTPTSTPKSTPTTAASPSPPVPEFPAQLLIITLVVSLVIVLSAVIIAGKRRSARFYNMSKLDTIRFTISEELCYCVTHC